MYIAWACFRNGSDVCAFFMGGQYQYATNVIRMSINEFVCLAETIGDPKVQVIWISTTCRCGGTLLTQVFESVPATLSVHQPDAPTLLHFLRENKDMTRNTCLS